MKIDNSNCNQEGYYCYDDPDKVSTIINGMTKGGTVPDNPFGIEGKFFYQSCKM